MIKVAKECLYHKKLFFDKAIHYTCTRRIASDIERCADHIEDTIKGVE